MRTPDQTGLHSYTYNDMKHRYPVTVKPLIAELGKFLEDEELVGDAFFCAPNVWRAREEEYGLNSDLILVYDGSYLYDIINGYSGDSSYYEQITELCAKHGYYFEPCTSWYCAFYKN